MLDFAAAREHREAKRRLPGWGLAGGAIAASLVAALVITLTRGNQPGYAGEHLAAALDTQLVATQPGNADTRILLSFKNDAGEYCRAYSASDASGIACRDAKGWRNQALGTGREASGSDYRMAGSDSELLAAAQDMAVGPALDNMGEARAQARGWHE